MNPIRKFAAIGSVAAGVSAVIAIAIVPETVLASDWNWTDSKPAAGQAFGLAMAEPSAECKAAVQALRDWRVADRIEDRNERLARQENGFDPVADAAEDKQERATMTALWDAIRAACQPQVAAVTAGGPPSDACTAAKQALKDAVAAQIARERAERANGTEGTAADAAADKQEHAQLKAVWDAKHAACGSQFQGNKANFGGSFGRNFGGGHHSR
jgi:hypothetical protein